MPNQSLVDLTERTATADTDLIHVNSGGTDYKQTKINFLRGDFFIVLSNSANITSSAESLEALGTYFGSISSYGHQSETGVPENTNFYFKIQRMGNANYISIELWNVNNVEGGHYIKSKVGGTWGDWVKVPSRSEITSLNNSLTKYYDTGAYPDITIGSNHEASFDKPSEVVGKKIVAINILSWSSATGAFFIAGMYDAQTKFFVGGDAGVIIKGLNLRVWYKD